MIQDDFKPGQVLTAGDLNAIRAELKRLGRVQAAPPLHVASDQSGIRFRLVERKTFTIKVTSGGTGGKYAWTLQIPATGGTWTSGTVTGTTSVDPAYEVNVNTAVPANTIILRAWRDPSTNVIFFERGAC